MGAASPARNPVKETCKGSYAQGQTTTQCGWLGIKTLCPRVSSLLANAVPCHVHEYSLCVCFCTHQSHGLGMNPRWRQGILQPTLSWSQNGCRIMSDIVHALCYTWSTCCMSVHATYLPAKQLWRYKDVNSYWPLWDMATLSGLEQVQAIGHGSNNV